MKFLIVGTFMISLECLLLSPLLVCVQTFVVDPTSGMSHAMFRNAAVRAGSSSSSFSLLYSKGKNEHYRNNNGNSFRRRGMSDNSNQHQQHHHQGLKQAMKTEEQLFQALDQLQRKLEVTLASTKINDDLIGDYKPFPSVRECNAALKNFADSNDLVRALKMFGRMRKAAAIEYRLYLTKGYHGRGLVPAPTLVTYSTLMSRAVSLKKPLVALRLWKLMMNTNKQDTCTQMIIPDVRATNILMNTYSKLNDVDSCINLLTQMENGDGPNVYFKMRPNIVTYNTLIDACRRSGELGIALDVRDEMRRKGIAPDARTYTSLISSVARKRSMTKWRHFSSDQKVELYLGASDPDMAFSLLDEMIIDGINPNAHTYCALIDVCGRCQRPEMALKGLRMMLRTKKVNDESLNEVGAWTAAIDACGKTARLDTAIKLFYSMERFGSVPNSVTCGCLLDSLLKADPIRTSDTLEVLRYMEEHSILPTEVTYTSLLSYAGRLIKKENESPVSDLESSSGIEIYIELMRNLMGSSRSTGPFKVNRTKNDPSAQLMQVFFVFQEMKAAGAEPDIAAFNVLLGACSLVGDVKHARDVLSRLQRDDLDPNERTWDLLLKTAASAGDSSFASTIWNSALNFQGRNKEYDMWIPTTRSFERLLDANIRDAMSVTSKRKQQELFENVISLYTGVYCEVDTGGLACLDINEVRKNQRILLQIIVAAVNLDALDIFENKQAKAVAIDLVPLVKLKKKIPHKTYKALQVAKSWQREKSARKSFVVADL